MAKRDQRGSLPPSSKPAGKKIAFDTLPSTSGQSEGDHRKKLPTQTPAASLDQPIDAPRPTVDRAELKENTPDLDSESSLFLSTAAPPPQPRALVQSAPAGAPAQILGTGRRVRTPLPQPVPTEKAKVAGGQLGQRQLGRGARGAGSPAKLEEKSEQFRFIKDFLQSSAPFDLRGKEIDTSSTPEEIESRKKEVGYQIRVMRSILTVLTDELKELEQARPPLSAAQTPPTQS